MTTVVEEFAKDVRNDQLRRELIEMIQGRHDATPRHLQKALGPSEIAHPCMRKMAFGITDVQRCNPQFDPLPSIIGTASHTWMESAARRANEELQRERWLIETKVEVAPGLTGSCDLYDHDTASVIDWKFPGTSRFEKYRKKMSPVYEGQIQLYGLGFANAGLPVKQVAIAMLPRGGTLTSMVLKTYDYDPDIAQTILSRRNAVIALLNDLAIEDNPERYQWISTEPYDCLWCPWHSANPTAPIQCDGKKS